jgi:carboxypeptidase family protein
MSRRSLSSSVWLWIALLSVPGFAWAQGSNATISGTVSDPSGGAVPGADMTLKTLGTGAIASTTSGPDGLYAFPNLAPGMYELTVAAKGFREYKQRGLSIGFNDKVRLDIKLELGPATTTVQVSANATPPKLRYAGAERDHLTRYHRTAPFDPFRSHSIRGRIRPPAPRCYIGGRRGPLEHQHSHQWRNQ